MHPGRLFRSLLRSLAAHALIIAIVAPCLGFQLHPQSPSTIFQGRPPHVLRQPPAGCRAALMLAKGDPRGPEHRLEEWLEELGAKTSALRVSDFSDGLRGVAATRDLAKGEVVLSVVCVFLPLLRSPCSPCCIHHGPFQVATILPHVCRPPKGPSLLTSHLVDLC